MRLKYSCHVFLYFVQFPFQIYLLNCFPISICDTILQENLNTENKFLRALLFDIEKKNYYNLIHATLKLREYFDSLTTPVRVLTTRVLWRWRGPSSWKPTLAMSTGWMRYAQYVSRDSG